MRSSLFFENGKPMNYRFRDYNPNIKRNQFHYKKNKWQRNIRGNPMTGRNINRYEEEKDYLSSNKFDAANENMMTINDYVDYCHNFPLNKRMLREYNAYMASRNFSVDAKSNTTLNSEDMMSGITAGESNDTFSSIDNTSMVTSSNYSNFSYANYKKCNMWNNANFKLKKEISCKVTSSNDFSQKCEYDGKNSLCDRKPRKPCNYFNKFDLIFEQPFERNQQSKPQNYFISPLTNYSWFYPINYKETHEGMNVNSTYMKKIPETKSNITQTSYYHNELEESSNDIRNPPHYLSINNPIKQLTGSSIFYNKNDTFIAKENPVQLNTTQTMKSTHAINTMNVNMENSLQSTHSIKESNTAQLSELNAETQNDNDNSNHNDCICDLPSNQKEDNMVDNTPEIYLKFKLENNIVKTIKVNKNANINELLLSEFKNINISIENINHIAHNIKHMLSKGKDVLTQEISNKTKKKLFKLHCYLKYFNKDKDERPQRHLADHSYDYESELYLKNFGSLHLTPADHDILDNINISY